MTNILVEFKGERYIWMRDDDGSDNGPIAYIEHIDGNGHVNVYDAFFSDSFAHVFDGVIKRYHDEIGTIADLKLLESDESH